MNRSMCSRFGLHHWEQQANSKHRLLPKRVLWGRSYYAFLALWFTEEAGNIGRVTSSGRFSEFPIPAANGVPFGITAGPDRALWFTELIGDKIGRITTAAAEPIRGDYKNAAKFCKADRAFLGDAAFREKYGTNRNGANAYGKCVNAD